MRRILPCLAAALLIGAAPAPRSARKAAPAVWVTYQADAANAVQQAFAAQGLVPPSVDETRDGIAVSLVREDQLDVLSAVMHERFRRCPGFVSHASRADALRAIALDAAPPVEDLTPFYVIDNPAAVNGILPLLRAANIEQTITGLASFSTRRHDQSGGTAAANWLRDQWQAFPLARFGATVELYIAATTPQPSVILTIPGSRRPDQVVVLGAHLDSINGGGSTALAPGADDDASGVATLTEVMRAMFAANFRPERTVKFMAYAGEEVGLRGSQAIATAHRDANVNVVGVLQLDMTNFKGSAHADIAIIADVGRVSVTQNAFLRVLIDTYVGVPWIETTCGYGCSDHQSWTTAGYRASFPFESQFGFHNQTIHTANDTLANSGGNADHSLKFAQLAAAYLAEVAKGRLVSPPIVPDASVPMVSGSRTR
jgi:leucyl aminopeptidase